MSTAGARRLAPIGAGATARTVSHRTVDSGIAAPGAPVGIDHLSVLDGFLYTGWNSGVPPFTSTRRWSSR